MKWTVEQARGFSFRISDSEYEFARNDLAQAVRLYSGGEKIVGPAFVKTWEHVGAAEAVRHTSVAEFLHWCLFYWTSGGFAVLTRPHYALTASCIPQYAAWKRSRLEVLEALTHGQRREFRRLMEAGESPEAVIADEDRIPASLCVRLDMLLAVAPSGIAEKHAPGWKDEITLQIYGAPEYLCVCPCLRQRVDLWLNASAPIQERRSDGA